MRIGIIGLGTVGQGVVNLLQRHSALYEERCGERLHIVGALVRDAGRAREFIPRSPALVTSDVQAFFQTKCDVIVEVAGGIEPARSHVLRALESGRDVVTANKALVAVHGSELYAAAERAQRRLMCEAAVAGGVPAIGFVMRSLSANRLASLMGIFNGTCNFILCAMEQGGTYSESLREAQRLGYAEADPTLDVSGRDSVEKLAIMATLAFGGVVNPLSIECEGIERIAPQDIREASERGERIRLVACASQTSEGAVMLWNGPTLVGADSILGRTMGADMAILAMGDATKWTASMGDGAGRFPTASAVVADILEVARLREFRPVVKRLNDWPTGAAPTPVSPWLGEVVIGRHGARMRRIAVSCRADS